MLYLAIPRETAGWFHPDYEQEIDRLYSEHDEIEPIDKLELASSPPSEEREPIDCFYYALEIYTREKLPEYWAMLQHNLGLAYFDRIKGERWDNLQRSIKCYHKSLEVFTQDKFPAKWQINQEDLSQSLKALKAEERDLISPTFKSKLDGQGQTEPRTPGLLTGRLGHTFFEPLSEEELQSWE